MAVQYFLYVFIKFRGCFSGIFTLCGLTYGRNYKSQFYGSQCIINFDQSSGCNMQLAINLTRFRYADFVWRVP